MYHKLGITPFVCAWLAVVFCAGCESAAWTHSLNEAFRSKDERKAGSEPRTEEEHRQEYIGTHSRKSMRWLLYHRVRPGVSYQDVCRLLGEDGERETKDRWLKTNGTNIRIDDEVYRFGPDDQGHTLYLFFRDDRLINYDRDEFR